MHLAAPTGDVMIGEEVTGGAHEKASAGADQAAVPLAVTTALALPARRRRRVGSFGMPFSQRLLGSRLLRL